MPRARRTAMQGAVPFFEFVLLLAALPTLALSRRVSGGWRSSAVFAAAYPAVVAIVGVVLTMVLLLVAPLGLIAFT